MLKMITTGIFALSLFATVSVGTSTNSKNSTISLKLNSAEAGAIGKCTLERCKKGKGKGKASISGK
jgi:hypothetical protein